MIYGNKGQVNGPIAEKGWPKKATGLGSKTREDHRQVGSNWKPGDSRQGGTRTKIPWLPGGCWKWEHYLVSSWLLFLSWNLNCLVDGRGGGAWGTKCDTKVATVRSPLTTVPTMTMTNDDVGRRVVNKMESQRHTWNFQTPRQTHR